MERYAVLNVGSGEILSPWYTTEARAHEVAAECESHETQPDCNVVRFSEWAPGRRLVALGGERWQGAYPLVTFGLDWSWVFTGEIVPAGEAGCTVTECGRAAYRRGIRTMTLITTAEQLADAIITDPERVAACLGRINRFGGQVANCTVLRHSLHVFERIDADPDSSDAARLWALLHDCHEILTGDVVRPYVNARLRMDQEYIDEVIVERLPMLVLLSEGFEWARVVAADRAVGEWEMLEIRQDRAPYSLYQFPTKSWADLVRGFIEQGAAR